MAPTFAHEDVLQYFELVDLPAEFIDYRHIPKDVEFLTALHVHQIPTFPYENLDMHYSPSHHISINPRKVFEKFCQYKGRGGHCMENNVFFVHMLKAIGFDCYHTGVHVRQRRGVVPEGPFLGLPHIVTIVTLEDGRKYHVDVSFSGDGPTQPMPLRDGEVLSNLGTQEVRLSRSTIAQFGSDFKWWIYQYRNQSDAAWNSYYCFYEIPFIHGDFEVINHSVCTQGYLPQNIVIVAFGRHAGRIAGKTMLINGTVKRNTGGRTRVVKEC
ncbi:cysteine proteinase [Setomelanomma holmii]|uniref:Cysteine proteinase n=1 Tax=Setomelanomma holmii TaxID=210430 RepID=A0A9P4LEN3_9PLEO|nr:cysteine proteinase [Setomelanomma holmii]